MGLKYIRETPKEQHEHEKPPPTKKGPEKIENSC
jgi:hypothetical protein